MAAATDVFRAVFAFGPVEDPALYGAGLLTYDPEKERENRLRSPIHFLGAIRTPTFVIEGTEGNVGSLQELKRACKNEQVSFLPVSGSDHFGLLAPVNEFIAGKIAKLEGDAALMLTGSDLNAACEEAAAARRESSDLRTLAAIRADGVDLDSRTTVEHYLLSMLKTLLSRASREAGKSGFKAGKIREFEDADGDPYYVLIISRKLVLSDLAAVFEASAAASKHQLQYDGWYVE